MASYRNIFRAMDSMLDRLKRKENTAEGRSLRILRRGIRNELTQNPEMLGETSVHKPQSSDNDDDDRNGVNVQNVNNTKNIIQMDEIPRAATSSTSTSIFENGESHHDNLEKSEVHNASPVGIRIIPHSEVFEGVHVDQVVAKLESKKGENDSDRTPSSASFGGAAERSEPSTGEDKLLSLHNDSLEDNASSDSYSDPSVLYYSSKGTEQKQENELLDNDTLEPYFGIKEYKQGGLKHSAFGVSKTDYKDRDEEERKENQPDRRQPDYEDKEHKYKGQSVVNDPAFIVDGQNDGSAKLVSIHSVEDGDSVESAMASTHTQARKGSLGNREIDAIHVDESFAALKDQHYSSHYDATVETMDSGAVDSLQVDAMSHDTKAVESRKEIGAISSTAAVVVEGGEKLSEERLTKEENAESMIEAVADSGDLSSMREVTEGQFQAETIVRRSSSVGEVTITRRLSLERSGSFSDSDDFEKGVKDQHYSSHYDATVETMDSGAVDSLHVDSMSHDTKAIESRTEIGAISSTAAVVEGVEKLSEERLTKEENAESMIGAVADSGDLSSMREVTEGQFQAETIVRRSSSVGEVTITRRLSLERSGSFSDSDNFEKRVEKEPEMEKVRLCDMEPKHFFNKVKFYPFLAVANVLVLIVQYAINGLSGSGPDGTIFKNSTGDLSDKYYTAITPAGWTFSIWGFIYTWQAAWVIFSLVNICRKGADGKPAYMNPPYIPNTVFVVQILLAGFNMAWLITFDREEIEAACAMLIIYTLLQYLLLTIAVRTLEQASPQLVQQNRTTDIWLHRGLLQNGIGMQLAWVNIATLLNLQMVLIYSGDKVLCADDAGTLALSILAVHLVVLPVVDMALLDRYTRYVMTPYVVVIVALAGSISKNWDSAKDNSIFSAVLISYGCLVFCVKLAVTIYRHVKRPRFTTTCPCKSLQQDYASTLDENEKGLEN